jgi:hypothetical protein
VGAYAARVAIAHWLPMESNADRIARESSASVDPDYVDLMTADF